MDKLTLLCLGALAALCAVPARALPYAPTEADVDTTPVVVPAFRIIDAEVPTEWYTVPDLDFSTEIDLGSQKNADTFFGPWTAVWNKTFQEGIAIDNCMARQLGAIAAQSTIVPCQVVTNK